VTSRTRRKKPIAALKCHRLMTLTIKIYISLSFEGMATKIMMYKF